MVQVRELGRVPAMILVREMVHGQATVDEEEMERGI
jgi:hypothetical protein